MTSQILATKLFIPSPGINQVSRSRLLDQLQSGTASKLTLISAPAGFGKTSLLSEWISACGYPACWLSLDERDNDIFRFLKYLIFALRQIDNDLGESALMMLQSSQPAEIEILLTGLINEIMAVPQSFVVVLDDYHVITEPKIQELLLFLVEHQPQQMHMIICSRADPPWPLSRLRVRAEVLEIRSQAMRFTLQETATFLNDSMGLALARDNIAALEKRTEGWIAGLQMAAISMQGRDDKEGFIQSFTGSHRFVMDYLLEEVLNQQPSEIRDFLLKTSVLERLTGPLCDVIVDGENSQSVLLDLEQKNLFLIPLDDQRRWYRYHHLFADLLRNHLHQTNPDEVPHLHHRASIWYGMNDLLPDAIKHALASNDIEGIIHLTRELALDTMDYGEFSDLMVWLNGLPEAEFSKYPWLWVARAQAYFKTGNFKLAAKDLAEAENVLLTCTEMDETMIHIQGHIAAIRSYLAEIRDDPLSAIQQAENALALLPEKDTKLRSYISIRWANCLVWFGDFGKAIPAYKEAGEASKIIGDGQTAIIALSEMAVVQMFAGNLKQAADDVNDIYRYAEELALRDGRRLPAMGVLYRHMSHIKRELNELPRARYYAEEAVKICQQWGEKEALVFGLLALTRIQFAQGEYERADQNLDQILRIASQISPKAIEQFQSWVLHYQLLRGRIAETQSWSEELGLTASDTFGYEARFEYQNYARLLVAKGDYTQAISVIDMLHKVAVEAGDLIYTIQYKVLQAVTLNKMNKPEEALAAMAEALSLARTGGYVRSILDEGHVVGNLLRTAISKGIETEYAGQLLAAIEKEPVSASQKVKPGSKMMDPLSNREMEVLRLLVSDLNASGIADELIVSVSTIRSHIKNIYSKLDVHSRYEAVSKAKDLNLL